MNRPKAGVRGSRGRSFHLTWSGEFTLALAFVIAAVSVLTGFSPLALFRPSDDVREVLERGRAIAERRAPPDWVPTVGAAGGRGASAKIAPSRVFDIVIEGGRVMDPATGFDHVAQVGIDGGKVAAISQEDLTGRKMIDATGRIVAPGFIDILSYDPNPFGIWYKVGDGVTTNLGMHGLNAEAGDWFERYETQGVPTHYGGAFDHAFERGIKMEIGVGETARPEQVDELVRRARQGIRAGWIGIDFELEYAPGTTYEEVVALSRVAARFDVPVFFHGRYSDMQEPGTNMDTVEEIINAARDTGAAVHVEHINSTGGTFSMRRSLAMLEDARAEGIDVTACTYPYNFWATSLASERFAPGWQERFRIDYGDLRIPGIGKPLTAETFEQYKAEKRNAAAFAIPEQDVRDSLASPLVMLGSDGILEGRGSDNHPRAAGTFARTLGKYVREEKLISMMDALAKMTIMPARRLQRRAPALRYKGRLQVGGDADITIFDPKTVIDRATIDHPARFSKGIDWVIVEGKVVKSPRRFFKNVLPGRPIKWAP